MKKIEMVRSRLDKAITSGCSKSIILNISRHLDELIVEHMKEMNKKYINKGR